MTYIVGFVTPVPDNNKEAYIEDARRAWKLFKEYGALEKMESWSDKVDEGKPLDLSCAVDLKEDETVCFIWMVWPDEETCNRCEASMEVDVRWQAIEFPFDTSRIKWGKFDSIFHARASGDVGD